MPKSQCVYYQKFAENSIYEYVRIRDSIMFGCDTDGLKDVISNDREKSYTA